MTTAPNHTVPDLTNALISLGIRQDGDEILTRLATHIDVLNEDPTLILDHLKSVMLRTLDLYSFRNGMGLSAPQIGISKSVCIFGDSLTSLISIVNPVITQVSAKYEDGYEGCLSHWACRGIVPRAHTITLTGLSERGTPVEHRLEGVMARMAQHEYDHLQGILYFSRMRRGQNVIGLEEYSELRRNR